MQSKVVSKWAALAAITVALTFAAYAAEETPASATTPAKTDAPSASVKVRPFPFHGVVGKVDMKAKSFTIPGKTSTRVFLIDEKTVIVKRGKPAKLSDAEPGEPVGGRAIRTDKPDVYQAVSIRFGPKPGSEQARVEAPDGQGG